ncbi:MAG: DUF2116 family Zn-ribbon domain-containing protein [Promethearchaeota archaeon]
MPESSEQLKPIQKKVKKKPKSGGWKQKLRQKIPPHKHCSVCGKSIPLDREFCSQECADKYRGFEKKKGRKSYIQIGFLVVMMVVFMFIFPLFMGGG